MKEFLTRGMLKTMVALVALFGCASGAEAFNPDKLLTESAFGVLGYGAVNTIVPHGDVTYIGGNFDELAAATGAFARLDISTAKRIAPLARPRAARCAQLLPTAKAASTWEAPSPTLVAGPAPASATSSPTAV